MNPIFAEAADTVTGAWIMGVMTAFFLFFFVGWILWAYDPRRKADFEDIARMPFDEGGTS